ncbi:MAG TPA: hypothetical protein PLA71_03050 [Saccharofermentans sp.]|nr:hypothetical protein [Saccharofermentans sp.]
MKTIFYLFLNTLSGKGNVITDDYIGIIPVEGILGYRAGLKSDYIPLTTEEANNILKKAGYRGNYNWNRLKFYDPIAQYFYDNFKINHSSLIDLCYEKEDKGIDPIPVIRELIRNKADVIKSTKVVDFYCRNKKDKGRLYIVILYEYYNDEIIGIDVFFDKYKQKKGGTQCRKKKKPYSTLQRRREKLKSLLGRLQN